MENKDLEKLSQPGNRETMRTITLEEHYATQHSGMVRDKNLRKWPKRESFSLGGLLKNCPISGIKESLQWMLQVLMSRFCRLPTPSVQQLDATGAVELAREANDYLSEAIRCHPKQFAGFATLPTAAPDIAAEEPERLVSEHGFKGGYINGHNQGHYMDDRFFWPRKKNESWNVLKLSRFHSISIQQCPRSR